MAFHGAPVLENGEFMQQRCEHVPSSPDKKSVSAGAVEFSQSSDFECPRCGPVVVTIPQIIVYSASAHDWLVTAIEDGSIQQAA
jgi:predicted RNA-binding Zn-ribbon protein involved in translation (DUF1610 family)